MTKEKDNAKYLFVKRFKEEHDKKIKATSHKYLFLLMKNIYKFSKNIEKLFRKIVKKFLFKF